MDHTIFKPIVEASYLTVENAWRYRALLRFFYEQHEKMRQYLFPEEVLAHVKKHDAFRMYTQEMLQQDLDQLVKWKNLIARQETGKVRTIEEFKKKRFRYQCSPYTVEIERMVQSLERMGDSFGGSLEKTLFDRLYETLNKVYLSMENGQVSSMSDEDCYRLWDDVFVYFKKLIQNSADYIAYINSENIEEKMMTESFLTYKDAFTEYLRDFIISLQQTSLHIEQLLKEMNESRLSFVMDKTANYLFNVPRLDEIDSSLEEVKADLRENWSSLRLWFLGQGSEESELLRLQSKTNETIRRMTRFAQRLGERHHHLRSRRKDYLHLASWFSNMETMEEAHKLSSAVFGVFHTKHLFTEEKTTEDIYRDIWDESPTEIIIKPRIRQYKEKTRSSVIEDFSLEKEIALSEHMNQKDKEMEEVMKYVMDGKIVFKDLPVIEPSVRKTLLLWIGKAMANKTRMIKTEIGQVIKVIERSGSFIELRATDGYLQMPDYEIVFVDGDV
ncbi:TIGR02677 family protein [Bacillus massilinigeriensis]|uniref:TIGR02677 family protein n=1 Tax=Bacillus mediterraneensis TaxID=1805474 RepID=UPI0008F8688A|nr:TIGR02677 family protein [Bacillus mediterraneensis]